MFGDDNEGERRGQVSQPAATNGIIAKMIEDYEEDALIWGAVSDDAIENAESVLGLKFPKEYRAFVNTYGSGGIGGVEIKGVEEEEASVVDATERCRKMGLDKNMIVIMDSGPFINCLDASEFGSVVYTLYRTDEGFSERRKDYDSFNEFVIDQFQEAAPDDTEIAFEPQFTEIQSDMVSLCMEYCEHAADEIYIVVIYNDAGGGACSYASNFFFKMRNELHKKSAMQEDLGYGIGNVPKETLYEALGVLNEDTAKLIQLCKEHNRTMPAVIKLTYNAKTENLEAEYKYEATEDSTLELTDKWIASLEGNEQNVKKNEAPNNVLLNPENFEIDEDSCEDTEKGIAACKKLIENWTPELENQMLEAFIKLYYNNMYKQWGPENEEENKAYWVEIKTPADLIKHTGTDILVYALEDAIHAKSKIEQGKYVSQNVDVCVILTLNCPWDKDHGWAAVFINEKFVTVGRDIVDCVWLD
jgi:hypothetical protein